MENNINAFSCYDTFRILYFNEQNVFVKLSSLVKYDTNNFILKEKDGICRENREIGNKFPDSRKNNENRLNNPFTKGLNNIKAI